MPERNQRLRSARVRIPSRRSLGAGLGRQELAELVNEWVHDHLGLTVGLDKNYIGKLERGVIRWPHTEYRAALRSILNTACDADLGFYDTRRMPRDGSGTNQRLGVLDGGDVPAWERADVVRAVVSAGVLPLAGSLLPLDPAEAEDSTDSSCRSYADVTSRLWTMYWDAPPAQLFDVCYAHTRHGVDLTRTAATADRAGLATSLALSALLTGRLAFFDLNRPGVADRCYRVALAATGEGADDTLATAVLGHMAFVPAFDHRPQPARALVAAGLAHARRTLPVARSWLHCVASEIEALAGDGAASRRCAEDAEATFNLSERPPGWMDFYDATRLDSFAGYAALADRDRAEAANRLTRCLAHLDVRAAKQRSVVLADLATVHSDDADRAAAYLDQAIDSLQIAWYRTGADRVRLVRAVLGDSSIGRRLDERLAPLVTSGPDRPN